MTELKTNAPRVPPIGFVLLWGSEVKHQRITSLRPEDAKSPFSIAAALGRARFVYINDFRARRARGVDALP